MARRCRRVLDRALRGNLDSIAPPSRRLMFGKHWAFASLNCPAQFRDIGNVSRIMLHPKLKQSAQINSPDTLHLGFAI
jgi:hypothetical protein